MTAESNIDIQYRECRSKIETLKQLISDKFKGQKENVLRLHALAAKQIGTKTLRNTSNNSEGFNGPSGGFFELQPHAAFRVRRRLIGHYDKITALHWSPDSQDLVSASQDGKLLVWNCFTTNKQIAVPLASGWVMTCAYSPSGDCIASGGLDTLCSIVNIRDIDGWEAKPFRELQQHEGYLSCARFVDNNQILTASGDSTCILWDIERQESLLHFREHTGDVQSIALNKHDRNLFVSGSTDATSKVWDMRLDPANGAIITFKGNKTNVNAVVWFPDGNAFVSGADDSTVRLFDLKAHRELNCYRDADIFSAVSSVDFSKSGHYLFVGYDEDPYCSVWNTMTAERLPNEMEHPTQVSCVQCSPKGHAFATGCWDKILRIWV